MLRITMITVAIMCSLQMLAQSPNFKDFNENELVEVGREDNFSSPRIIGKSGSSVFFMQRDMKKSGFVSSTLFKIDEGVLVKEVELSPSRGEGKIFVNARTFKGGVLCYGYNYKNRNEEADLIFRIYDTNLDPLTSDYVIGSVILDDEMLPLGVIKNQMTNIGALPVVRANFASDIYPSSDGNYEIWMTRLGVGPGLNKRLKAKSNAEAEIFKAQAEAVSFHHIVFTSSGDVISNTSIPINNFERGEKEVIAGASSINDCQYIKTENGVIACLEKMVFPDNAGMNIYDDNRFQTVNIYHTAVLKFENNSLTTYYTSERKYNHLTRNIHQLNDELLITGFYTIGSQTNWKGVFRLKLDNDLKLVEEEYRPLEGNYTQEGLDGADAYSMRGYKENSKGVIRESELKILENGSMILTGQLYTQLMVTGDPYSKVMFVPKQDFHGKLVTSTFTSETAKNVTHFYNKIVAFQLLPDGTFSGNAFTIPLKQKKVHISPKFLGYSCTTDGHKVRILFNDTPDIFSKNYYSKNNFYTNDTGKNQLLQEYIVDDEFNIQRNVYKRKSSMTLIPNATVDYDNGSLLLYSDGKRLYVKEK